MKPRVIQSQCYKSGGYYVIKPKGQQAPREGDGVIVTAEIRLPTDQNGYWLSPDIEFGDRLKVADEPLKHYWGTGRGAEGHRFIERDFAAKKWADAEKSAVAWATAELEKLDAALAKRERALKAAEK